MKLRASILALTLLLTAGIAGCGGGGNAKVDTGKLSTELQKSGMGKKEADCMATALDKAGLTADDFKKFGGGTKPDLNDPKVKAYTKEAVKCFTAGTTPGG
ncbi:MAG: hypothetical protein ACR2MB_15705 [Acidimicrobiales bacterium]